MILYGSTTSPYVRRIRLMLQGVDYEFQRTQVFKKSTDKTLLRSIRS